MDGDEQNWVENATRLCERAIAQKVTVLFIRHADEADVVVTNAVDAAMVEALTAASVDEDED